MNKSKFEKHLNEQYSEMSAEDIQKELGYLVEGKKVSPATFKIYINHKMVGTMLKRLDNKAFNLKYLQR